MITFISLLVAAAPAAPLLDLVRRRGLDPCEISLSVGLDPDRNLGVLDLSYRGQWQGHVAALRPRGTPPAKRDGFMSSHSHLEPRFHRKGLGTLMYAAATAAFRADGVRLVSSAHPGPLATRMWAELRRRGFARPVAIGDGHERLELDVDALLAADPGLAAFLAEQLGQ